MTIIILAAICLLLILILILAIKKNTNAKKYYLEHIKNLEKIIEELKENEKRKEKLNTGNPDTDFDNSIDILHKLAGQK